LLSKRGIFREERRRNETQKDKQKKNKREGNGMLESAVCF
jgi:hypothetical protein